MNKNLEKGKRFERRIARAFQDATGFRFFRNVVNRSTGIADAGMVGGDIGTDRKDFPFCIECKAHKAFSLSAVFCGKIGMLEEFWNQTREEAEKVRKIAMLVVTGSNMNEVFVVTYAAIMLESHKQLHSVMYYQRTIGDSITKLVIMPLQSFLQLIKENKSWV